MVKYLRSIELIADYRSTGEGQGGSREDTMFYGRGAEIEVRARDEHQTVQPGDAAGQAAGAKPHV